MRKLGLTISCCCCAIGMYAQTYGQMYNAVGQYEMDSTVLVTKYVKGVPQENYKVTGDDKLRIMKAIGDIMERYQAEEVPVEDSISVFPLYAYHRNVAELDKGVVYEIAPFKCYQMTPYRNLKGTKRRNHMPIGGILISAEKKDSTVVLGTVHGRTQGKKNYYAYPYQYVKAIPVKGQQTLEQVKTLRKIMKKLHKHKITFPHYISTWEIEEPGVATIKWHKNGVVTRIQNIHSDKLMPVLENYLQTTAIDKTGRGYYQTLVVPNGYRTGMTAENFTKETYNSYKDILKKEAIEICLPSKIKNINNKGIIIQTGNITNRIYGVGDNEIVGPPYLFYTDKSKTRNFNTWLKKNSNKPK